jgi:hypothetical protein
MIGIVIHNPLTISVILDRGVFRNQLISTDDILSDTWKEKIHVFSSSPRDGRQKVLFIEKLSGLQFMLRGGFDPASFKVVLYDTCDVINKLQGVEIVDAKMTTGETWAVYKLLPERFNAALSGTTTGIPDGILTVDPKKIEDAKTPKAGTRRKKSSLDDINKTMKKLTADPVKEKEAEKPVEPKPEEPKKGSATAAPKPPDESKEKPKKVKLESYKLF